MTTKTELPERISRREAVRRVSALLGGATLIGGNALLNLCAADEWVSTASEAALFSAEDLAFLEEVAETILPETITPGARAAGVGPFVVLMVTEAYSPDDQQVFVTGMRAMQEQCLSMHGAAFMSVTPQQRLALLEAVDLEQMEYMKARAEDDPAHYFRMMKELVLLGYFTSEIGCTQAMRYQETPGHFDPCAPYQVGDKAWAEHA